MPRSDSDSAAMVQLQSILETIAHLITTVGLAIWALALCYLGYGLFSGQIFDVDAAAMPRVTANVKTASEVLMYLGGVVAAVLVLRQKTETTELYSLIVVAGLLLWFGLPAGMRYWGPSGEPGEAAILLVQNVARAGQILIAVMAIPLLVGIWRAVRVQPLKRASDEYEKSAKLGREGAKTAKGRPNFLSACWRLPYCRDYLLEVCPAYKARRRCWKFGGGCFCDQRMIESMMRGLSGVQRKTEEGYMRAEIDARTGVMQHRSKKPPCHKCFIYLEHEKLKFDAMAPLMYPLCGVGLYLIYEPILKPGWLQAQVFLAQTWQRLAFSEVQTTIDTMKEVPGMETAGLIFTVVVGIFSLLGLLRFCELWCFKWKL